MKAGTNVLLNVFLMQGTKSQQHSQAIILLGIELHVLKHS